MCSLTGKHAYFKNQRDFSLNELQEGQTKLGKQRVQERLSRLVVFVARKRKLK